MATKDVRVNDPMLDPVTGEDRVIAPGHTFKSVTEKISRIVLTPHTPLGWFFGLLIAELLSSLLKEFVLSGGYHEKANLVFHIVFLAATVLTMAVRNETFHKAAAVIGLTLFVVYSVLLFWRLG